MLRNNSAGNNCRLQTARSGIETPPIRDCLSSARIAFFQGTELFVRLQPMAFVFSIIQQRSVGSAGSSISPTLLIM
jgi:hypothetical protein